MLKYGPSCSARVSFEIPSEAWPLPPHLQQLLPKRTTLQARVPTPDRGMLHFIRHLLVLDPARRPTAEQALRHPWLQYRYRSPK